MSDNNTNSNTQPPPAASRPPQRPASAPARVHSSSDPPAPALTSTQPDTHARPLLYSLSPRRHQFFAAGGASRAIRGGSDVYHDDRYTGGDSDADHLGRPVAASAVHTVPASRSKSPSDRAAAACGLPASDDALSPTNKLMVRAVSSSVAAQGGSADFTGNEDERHGGGGGSQRWPSNSVVEPLCAAPGYFDVREPLCAFDHDISDWGFDAFNWAQKIGSPGLLFEAVAVKVGAFLEIFEGQRHATIERARLVACVRALGPLYKTEQQGVPFHTVLQASCRTMALASLLSHLQPLLSVMSGVERAAVLCASLACDVAHPGRSSSFLNAVLDPLSLRYNNIAPLEQFAASLFFSVLQQEPDCDVTAGMDAAALRDFRAAVCAHVLATELAGSGALVESVETRLASKALRPLESGATEHRREILGVVLHAADVCNVARPPLTAARWARALHQEFQKQHADEIARGIPATPEMAPDADRTRATVLFIDLHVEPLYEALARINGGSGAAAASSSSAVLPAITQLRQNRTVLAARAGIDAVARSRWPVVSIVEPCVPQPYERPEEGQAFEDLLPSNEMRSWDFDAFALAEGRFGGGTKGQMTLLMAVAFRVAEDWGLLKPSLASSFSSVPGASPKHAGQQQQDALFSREQYERFIFALGSRYRDNPYHSILHAADVTQATFAMLAFVQPPLLPLMDRVEKVGLLLSALAHDLGHAGKNNMFLINTRDPVAVKYNQQSVLENFHAQSLFALLRDPALDVTAGLSATELSRLWTFTSKAILGTDMALHQVHLDEFDKKISSGALNPWAEQADRQKVLAILMHCADVSNPTRSAAISEKWDAAVAAEFFQQGDAEAALGLPISPGMNRTADAAARARGTLFFVDFYLAPLVTSLSKIMRSESPMLRNLLANRAAAAAKAGVPAQQAKTRWPSNSVVEPVRVQKYDAENNNAANFTLSAEELKKWDCFDAFEWAAKCGPIGLFEAVANKVADAWDIFAAPTSTSGDASSAPAGGIDRGAWAKLVRKLALLYRSPAEAPYHNAIQAAERTVAMYQLLAVTTNPPLLPRLSVVDRAAVLVAMLGADCGHCALSNQTLARIRDPVSVRFSQKQVLENFTSQLVLTTMRQDDGCDITANLSDEHVATFCDVFWSVIMNTSMEKHSVADFDARLREGKLQPLSSREDAIEIVAKIGHLADIANQMRPAVPASRFSRAINDETDLEAAFLAERGLSVPPHMRKDRDRGKAQLIWCESFVLPLMRAVARLMPGQSAPLETLLLNVEIMRAQAGM